MSLRPPPFEIFDPPSGTSGDSRPGAARVMLPVAVIGLLVTFGLFWLMQLFGQWYVRTRLDDNVQQLLAASRDAVQRKISVIGVLERAAAVGNASFGPVLAAACGEKKWFGCVILQNGRAQFLGRPPENYRWPRVREDWDALLLGTEWLNASTALFVALGGGQNRPVLFFSPRPFNRETPLANTHILGFLDLDALLSNLKPRIENGQIDELAILTPGKKRVLASLTDSGAQTFMPLIRGEAPWQIGGLPLNLLYGVAPARFVLWVIVLPYLGLAVGLGLLALALMHFWRTWTREQQVHDLARSLTRTVSELEQRIVESELMSAAQRESERKYRAIFENASIGICQISSRNEWINANRTLANLLGYRDVVALLAAQPDFHGKLFAETAARANWIRAMLESGVVRDFEAGLVRRDDEKIWVSINSHAVRSESGHLLHFEATFTDVTERRRSEMALIAAKEQADYANRSKSEFLANMSHELRTPLNAIIGFSEIIKDELFGKAGNPQYVEYARDIYDSGELLLSLINDILDMSKIEAGKRDLAESVINIGRVMQAGLRLVAARAKANKQKLNVNIPRDFPDLRGEEKAVKQIIVNLLTNAIKFTPEGGEITVHGAVGADGEMRLSVQDTGIGIAPEHLSVVLAPFGQIESALSRKNQGTGLGLPLTKALVELHGGALGIESTLGVGTTVTVTFSQDRVLQQVL